MRKASDLPEWAQKMTDEEWEQEKRKHKSECEKWNLGDSYLSLNNCSVCGKRLILTLCKYLEPKFYCFEHCPKHKWQSDYDWVKECALCGVHYETYLEYLLEKNKVNFEK